MTFASAWNKSLKHYISAEILLMQGYAQGALRNELLMATFIERFKTAALEKS